MSRPYQLIDGTWVRVALDWDWYENKATDEDKQVVAEFMQLLCDKAREKSENEDRNMPTSIRGLDFGTALAEIKKGRLMRRSGWNGKGMFLYLVEGSQFKVNRAPLLGIYPHGTEIDYCPHIDMKTADGKCVPWLASQTDVLAEDWEYADV